MTYLGSRREPATWNLNDPCEAFTFARVLKARSVETDGSGYDPVLW
jgi:hypothetical protein